jgi:hypothetical protein
MRIRTLVPVLAAACCWAGDAAPATAPLATVAIADGTVLQKHWQASLYGQVWADPGMAWVREQAAAGLAQLKAEQGLDLEALLAAMKDVRAEFIGMEPGSEPKPQFRLQADCGAQAAALMTLAAKDARGAAPAVPGADQAVAVGDGVLARFGTRLVLAFNTDAKPWPVQPTANDGRLSIDYKRFMGLMADIQRQMPGGAPESLDAMLVKLEPWFGTLVWTSDLVAQGMHEVMLYDRSSPGLLPVDRAQLDRMPANALLGAAMGFDLGKVWPLFGEMWLDSIDQAMHGFEKTGPAATKAEIDQILIGLGVAGGLDALVKDLRGTVVFAITPGMPIPGFTLTLPRSPSVDALVAAGLAQLGAAPPAEGASAMVAIPNAPVVPQVARDAGHWLITTDAALAGDWLAKRGGGFNASVTGKAILAKAPADAYLLAGLDTAGALRLAAPFVGMGAQQMPLDAKGRQSVLAGFNRLATLAGPSIWWSQDGAKGNRTEADGPLGMGVMPIAVIAAIAIPNLLESRVTAQESAAGATLRSGIFPAQIQFQGGSYRDGDQDNIGEYGGLGQLSGRIATDKMEAGNLKLLTGPLGQGDTSSGYRFKIWLPDGKGGAVDGDQAAPAGSADAQERGFLALAWPLSDEQGRTMFALGMDGQLRSLPWDGQEPTWQSALGDGWDAPPTWPTHQQGRRNAAPAPRPADPKALF